MSGYTAMTQFLFRGAGGEASSHPHVGLKRLYHVGSLIRDDHFERSLPRRELEDDEATRVLRQWLEGIPEVREWIVSDDWFRAPKEWPQGFARYFRSPMSPYEMSAMVNARGSGAEIGAMQAYCHGLPKEVVQEFLPGSEEVLVSALEFAVDMYRGNPNFTLWELNLDWKKVILPELMSDRLLERLAIRNKLQLSPLDVKQTHASALVSSPRFMSYAIQVAPRKRRLRSGKLSWGTSRRVKPPKELVD